MVNLYPYITSKDVFLKIFETLLSIWQKTEGETPSDHYERAENKSREFESKFMRDYPEIYDKLLKKCQGDSVKNNPFIQVDALNPVLIFDALSIREIPILKNNILGRLIKQGSQMTTYSFKHGFSAVPSTTSAFTQTRLSAPAPSKVTDKDFQHLIYEEGKKQSLQRGKKIYWSTIPDALFHKTDRELSIESLLGIWIEQATQLIQDLLSGSIETLTITSDHGYLYKPKAYSISLSDQKIEKKLKTQFKNNRYIDNTTESYPANIVKKSQQNAMLVGRIHPGGNQMSGWMTHGGLSFLECLTPKIIITK